MSQPPGPEQGSFGLRAAPQQWHARPSAQELLRLHHELGLWMSHTRYKLQPKEQIPLWRVQNTSMTVSTGAGVGSFYVFRRLTPQLKFPIDIIPPFIMFYLTYQAAQSWQMPGLYDSFLSFASPLGVTTRGILSALRSGSTLPSNEFGNKLRPPDPPGTRPPGAGLPDTAAPGAPADLAGDPSAAIAPPAQTADSPVPAAPDPWADAKWDTAPAGEASWGEGDWSSAGPRPKVRQYKSWDEIRAQTAQQEAERRSS